MAKFALLILFTTVLLGTTTAVWKCVMDAKKPVIPEQFFTDAGTACSDLEKKFNGVRQKLTQCLHYELDISNLESLFYEFCGKTSDFHEKVPRQLRCISSNILKLFDCTSNLESSSPDPLPFKIRTKSWRSREVYDACQSISADMSNCSTYKVAGPCGPEGMEVFGRMQVASEPFLTGACLAIAKREVENKNFMNEMEEVEEEDADTSMAKFEQTLISTTAAATDHFVPTWYIVIGLLLAATWW